MKKILSSGLLAILLSSPLMADPQLLFGMGWNVGTLNIEKMADNTANSLIVETGFLYDNHHYITLKADLFGNYYYNDVNLNSQDYSLTYKYKFTNNSKFSPYVGAGAGFVLFDTSGSTIPAGNFKTSGLTTSGTFGSFYDIDENWEIGAGFEYSYYFVDYTYETGGAFVPNDKYSMNLQMNYKF